MLRAKEKPSGYAVIEDSLSMTVSIMGGIDRSVQQKETDGPNENVYMRRCYMQVQGAGGVVLWAKTSTRERREKERNSL